MFCVVFILGVANLVITNISVNQELEEFMTHPIIDAFFDEATFTVTSLRGGLRR